MFQHRAIKLFCFTHLAMEETETNFRAVNHSSVILHIDAAFLPATGRVIRKGRIPFNVFYCLQIFRGQFLQPVMTVVKFRHDTNKPVCQRDGIKNRTQVDTFTRVVLFGMQIIVMLSLLYKLMEFLTFLGVTVHNMLMMLLDFSCPS